MNKRLSSAIPVKSLQIVLLFWLQLAQEVELRGPGGVTSRVTLRKADHERQGGQEETGEGGVSTSRRTHVTDAE